MLILGTLIAIMLSYSGALAQVPTPKIQTRPFIVTIQTSVSGGARPIVMGRTNLPDGTVLMMWLTKPWLSNARERIAVGLSACGDSCFPLTVSGSTFDEVKVKNGQFTWGPVLDNGGALKSGTYTLEVNSRGGRDQPPEVRAIIGQRGENMAGPLIGGCCFAYHDRAEVQKGMEAARKITRVFGAFIYYARTVEVGAR
jgi:hypothetical protein